MCDEILDESIFSLILLLHTRRLQCVTGGMFQCRATGLVFGMKGRGCVEYSVVQWDMQSLSNIHEPAGPLFDIETPEGEMYQLRLPHCEAEGESQPSI